MSVCLSVCQCCQHLINDNHCNTTSNVNVAHVITMAFARVHTVHFMYKLTSGWPPALKPPTTCALSRCERLLPSAASIECDVLSHSQPVEMVMEQHRYNSSNPFNGPLFRLIHVSHYQKKHSLTHTLSLLLLCNIFN